MKNRASVFLKQLMSVLSSMVKAKSLALKNKTSAMKSRLIILSFLKNKKLLLSSITHKIHALVAQQENDGYDQSSSSNAIVLHHHAHMANASCTDHHELVIKVGDDDNDNDQKKLYYEDDYDEKYPDLRHSLFESEEDEVDDDDDEDDDDLGGGVPGESVIDVVRNGKEDKGENFKLEDEINEVADLFIRRFHRQMKIQKQESFKRYREMLERSV